MQDRGRTPRWAIAVRSSDRVRHPVPPPGGRRWCAWRPTVPNEDAWSPESEGIDTPHPAVALAHGPGVRCGRPALLGGAGAAPPPVRSASDVGRRPGPHRPAHPAGADLEAATGRLRPEQLEPPRSFVLLPPVSRLSGLGRGCTVTFHRCHVAERAVRRGLCRARSIPEHTRPCAVGRGVDLCPRGSTGRIGIRIHDVLRNHSGRSGQPLEPDGRDVPAPSYGPAVCSRGRPFRAFTVGGVGDRFICRTDRHLHRPGGGGGRRVGDSGLGGHVGGRPRPAGSWKTCRGQAARLVGSSALDRRTNPVHWHRGHCRCDVAPSLRPTAVQQPGKLHAHRPVLLPSPRDVPLCGRLEISAVGGRRPSRRTGRGHALALGPGCPPSGPGMDGDGDNRTGNRGRSGGRRGSTQPFRTRDRPGCLSRQCGRGDSGYARGRLHLRVPLDLGRRPTGRRPYRSGSTGRARGMAVAVVAVASTGDCFGGPAVGSVHRGRRGMCTWRWCE